MKKNRLRPYQNWNEKEFKDIMIRHIKGLIIDVKLKNLWIELITDAFNSENWDVLNDYNGCTIVQDYLQPSMSCFCHDFMWITGHGGIMADRIFKFLMKAQGLPKGKANRRWFGVRVGWIFGFYWKYKFKGELKPPTKSMINLNNYIKNL